MSHSCKCGSMTFGQGFEDVVPDADHNLWHSLARCGMLTCPFCFNGYWDVTGTSGRLACSACGSIALDGQKKEVVIHD